MLREIHFTLGSVQVALSTHGLAVLVGVAAGAALALRRARDVDVVLVALAVAAPATLGGAWLLHRLVHGAGSGPGGLSSMGGVAGLLIAAWVVARLARQPVGDVLDALAPGALLALAIGRVGCFLAGCCYGGPTELTWGVVFPELGPPARHPLQLYSAMVDPGLLAFLPRADAPRGAVARSAAMGFGVLRAALEMLRDPAAADVLPGGVLTLAQAAALMLAATAVAARPARLRHPEPSTMAPPRRRAPHGG